MKHTRPAACHLQGCVTFPRSSERGPIEAVHRLVAATRCVASHFRAHRSAAPLKHVSDQSRRCRRAHEFPRSSERGPIEATQSPLEPPDLHRFPRSSERGPIEARSCESRLLTAQESYDFRAHRSAAPLKPDPRRTSFAIGAQFPRSSERGPIEAIGVGSRVDPRAGDFRAHRSAAPLKHYADAQHLPRLASISALIGARPH